MGHDGFLRARVAPDGMSAPKEGILAEVVETKTRGGGDQMVNSIRSRDPETKWAENDSDGKPYLAAS